jgi:hypothetical protein
MAFFKAKHNGYLSTFKINGVESTGLVARGDVIEYSGIRRLWLEPLECTDKKVEEVAEVPVVTETTMSFAQLNEALSKKSAVKGKTK